MTERRALPIEERILKLEQWQLNIYSSNNFLTQDLNRLWEVDPSEREGQALRIRSRIVNLTRAVREAYESNYVPGDFPDYRLIDRLQDGPRYYYFFEESEIKRITTPPRIFHNLRGEDFTKSEIIPAEEWIMDDHLRDRVVQNLRGLVPYEIRSFK